MSTPMPRDPQPPLWPPAPPASSTPHTPGRDGLPPAPPDHDPRPAGRTPLVGWPWWTAFVALLAAFALAVFAGLVLVGIPAALLHVHYVGSHIPGGIAIASTVVQDLAFVAGPVLVAGIGGRVVGAWQFGLRRPRVGPRMLAGAVVVTYGGFLLFGFVWSTALHITEKEKLLETLGANEGAALLIMSAALTCVLAPICEEFLFRGYFFRSLSNLRGPWPAAVVTGIFFGLVHALSAPAADLAPLAVLGFGLCWLYMTTGSLYPCIAVHALNNCLAFGELESWSWQIPVLAAAVFAALALVWLALTRTGVIGREPETAIMWTAHGG